MDMRQLDLDRSREVFLHLATDPDEDVRWRVAGGLVGQFEREDVKSVIATLLNDKSLSVRYMTILAVGPEKFVKELQELAHGPDPRIADWATQKIEQISGKK
jgi:HEAT repeat protein